MYGDKEKNLNLILSGSLAKFRKNEEIEDWYWALSVYNALRLWVNKIFYKKIKHVIWQEYQNYILQVECVLNRKIREKLKVAVLPKDL